MKKHLKNTGIAFLLLIAVIGCSKSDDSNGETTPSDPNQALITKLSGGSSKKWYWSASEIGHLGSGINNGDKTLNFYGSTYQSPTFEFANTDNSCLYDNVLTFSLQDNALKFSLDNGGHTFFNMTYLATGSGSGTTDACLPYTTSGVKNVTISDSDSVVVQNGVTGQTTGKAMTFSDGGFMGYYIGQSTYEILSVSDTRMVVRALQGNDPTKAWYHTFTTTKPVLPASEVFNTLAWSDEFNTPGAPDPTKWGYNLGNNNGWGNNELETYTNSLSNAEVVGGMLKITAKKETDGSYTSARLVSENHYAFTYGRIEFRAKLPSGGGTWPAIWMLGKNYPTNAWPACGEIDMMEHVGNQQNKIFATLHYPGHSGANGTGSTTMIPTASTEFHNYSVIWNPDVIKFYVDGTVFYSFANNASTPFNLDFFFIMNVAIGGNFGGSVDPAFTQSSMEVDYIRVYK